MENENIFKAVEKGITQEVKKALREEKINTATYYGAKSIILAAKQGNCEILKMLLESVKNDTREHFWLRDIALSKNSAFPNIAMSVLSFAVGSENTEILKLLLEFGIGTDRTNLD